LAGPVEPHRAARKATGIASRDGGEILSKRRDGAIHIVITAQAVGIERNSNAGRPQNAPAAGGLTRYGGRSEAP
jgi:hypothetical protein